MSDSNNERLASVRAVAEALVGVPIVITQQIVQRLGDIGVGHDTTLAQRLAKLRSLGELTLRLGTREVGKRLAGRNK